jgi:hypothetical protein
VYSGLVEVPSSLLLVEARSDNAGIRLGRIVLGLLIRITAVLHYTLRRSDARAYTMSGIHPSPFIEDRVTWNIVEENRNL